MPAIRKEKKLTVQLVKKPMPPALVALEHILTSLDDSDDSTTRDFADVTTIHYPKGDIQRESYKTPAGKRIPAHHWAVYDLIMHIPVGTVSTYKDVCLALGQGSPRSVGNALRNNPFAPYVPCHRIVASNRSIGGFCGERDGKPGSGKEGKERSGKTLSHCDWKVRMLTLEGVKFDSKGYLLDAESVMWKPAE